MAKHMQNVVIKTIHHKDQRYVTVGDWQDTAVLRNLLITVSRMSDPRYEQLVAVHELIEALLCKQRGVSQESVDEFDKKYEENRQEDDFSEPGDSPEAPYMREHKFATVVEKMLALELGVDWDSYAAEVEAL